EGIADPDHLTIGGYSYGGYMTNWLITQTTRFKAAVTGAGAVEHAANWGNDDLTFDDAFYLGGRPWEAQAMYNDEAALFQMNKVKTPTHVVGGGDDIRVAVAEDYLLEHALDLSGRGPFALEKSVARKDKGAGRVEMAGEVRSRAGDGCGIKITPK